MESSLSIPYKELAGEVGSFLGFGRGAEFGEKAWTDKNIRDIESCIKAGYHNFIYPPLLPGEATCYNWSFLRPVKTLTLASGASTITLPDDFGNMEGQLTISGQLNRVVEITGEGAIRARYLSEDGATGAPVMAAVRPLKATTALTSQRFELYVFPTADDDYDIECSYAFLPDALTVPKPYPIGGAAHAQTVLESCLAVAEHRRDNERSTHYAMFQERLAASVAYDKRLKPQHFGRNADRSDMNRAGARWSGHAMQQSVASYNGDFY